MGPTVALGPLLFVSLGHNKKIKVMSIKMISRLKAKEMLSELKNGTIYSVTFLKKDGTLRLMNSIKGTSRGVKGVGLKFDAEERNLIPVYDIQLAKKDPSNPDKCWRMVNIETITEVKVNNESYAVVD